MNEAGDPELEEAGHDTDSESDSDSDTSLRTYHGLSCPMHYAAYLSRKPMRKSLRRNGAHRPRIAPAALS